MDGVRQPHLPVLADAPKTPSRGLWRLLTQDEGAGVSRQIALAPALRNEAAEVLPSLNARVRSPEAPLSELKALFTRQALALGIPDRSPGEWASLFEIYARTLAGFSLEALEAAFDRWNACELYPAQPSRHAFFPKPAELLTLAERHMSELRMAAYRAKKAMEFVEDKGLEWTPERKQAERAKMIELGLLTPDGKPNFVIGGAKSLAEAPRLASTQHQAAERIRELANRQDEVGDVV